MKKKSNFKIFKIMKGMFKIIFNHVLLTNLMISFEDLNLIFYIWVFNIIIEVIIKKSNLNNILLLF